jgi:HSP20 family molecular chaperone IbpA
MADRKAPAPPDDGWRDIHLEDILKGVGTFITLVSDVVEAVNNTRGTRARSIGRAEQPAPARLSAGSALAGMRDPIVDLFDEDEEIILIVEWPYVDEGPIRVELQDDVLSLTIAGERPYTAELLLPSAVDATTLRQTYHNGMTEVRLRRA